MSSSPILTEGHFSRENDFYTKYFFYTFDTLDGFKQNIVLEHCLFYRVIFKVEIKIPSTVEVEIDRLVDLNRDPVESL